MDKISLGQQQGKKFTYTLQIKEHHLDTFGHVNNAVYLQLFEEARWEFINNNDFGLQRILKEQIGPVILEVNVKFKQELKNRENIIIESCCTQVKKNLILSFEQTILNEKKQTCCLATFTIGIMDFHERRLIPLSPDWLRAVGYGEITITK